MNIVNRIFCNISLLFGRTSETVFLFSLCLSLSCSLLLSAFFSLSLLLLSGCIPTSCVNNSILSVAFIAVNVSSSPNSAGFLFFPELLSMCILCGYQLGVCTFCPPWCFKWFFLLLSSSIWWSFCNGDCREDTGWAIHRSLPPKKNKQSCATLCSLNSQPRRGSLVLFTIKTSQSWPL